MNNFITLGDESEAAAYNSVALGASSLANRPNTVSVDEGDYNLYRQITNVADGVYDFDAVNSAEVLQLRQEVVMMHSQQAETDKKLYKQAEMESELKQLRRELLELKKALKK
ncbi:hypothetical protein MY596_07260 [Haemophilus influenzae]|uniref:Uncharacterized protein n=1 Tax=Haemophilus influenzae TaxID=727 RepID=A0A2S9RYW2_HAEIF|nr:hypothetical protein [Haemophilus influenzae]EEW78772.1 predicted protein [Haemophilus influenzae NT127]MCK8795090.1 hypothetical protein [Haemophilus influenzae]MCK8829799.1 hypothetical protein [Haemophilus influenzae]MCK8840276.1 hypothetical protein [Haemophilus influenzae]MCK8909144.1 hypothetical protein [Haemophilus influenzae]